MIEWRGLPCTGSKHDGYQGDDSATRYDLDHCAFLEL
jgi:hypothetical protein